MAGTLKRNVSKFIDDNIPGPVKKVLGINSPSKLMEEEVGEPVGEGTEIGIDNKYKDIAAAAKRMASAAIPKIEEPAIPAFAVAGPPTNDQGTNEPHNYRNNREQPVTAIFQINDREFARATAYASEEEKQRREKLESRAGGDF
ncbi:hypothetical protein [Thalassobacillus sp. C254]|uniref:hypothetical protein n=1 Tax=Thalassobacillus sp. C254 TaxID=1225341 RepID=UPI0006D0378A|nr:hypothetical protein [Thalassobacillus sp. C254]